MPFGFDLLPEGLFYLSAFLNVTGFKSGTFLRIQLKTRVANSCVSFAGNNLSTHSLSLTHEIALLWAHLHPKLGIAAEALPGVRWHREPALPHALPCSSSTGRPCGWSMGLAIGGP